MNVDFSNVQVRAIKSNDIQMQQILDGYCMKEVKRRGKDKVVREWNGQKLALVKQKGILAKN